VGEWRCAHRILVGRPDGKRPLERPRNGGENKLKLTFRKWKALAGTGMIYLRIGTGAGGL
jgi:hypothetical protein